MFCIDLDRTIKDSTRLSLHLHQSDCNNKYYVADDSLDNNTVYLYRYNFKLNNSGLDHFVF